MERGNEMLGLKRGQVRLEAWRPEWAEKAQETAEVLKQVLGEAAADIQHVGSTAIPGICAKPIVDLVVGFRQLGEARAFLPALEERGVVFRGQDVPGQLLFVTGDFEQDTRDCHIHGVEYGGEAWENYLNFRDYLRAKPERAAAYNALKGELAARFPQDRQRYTQGKSGLIDALLEEARRWRARQG